MPLASGAAAMPPVASQPDCAPACAPALQSAGSCAPALQSAGIPPGWHLDETTGCLVRDVVHRMGRRAFRWDYCGIGAYLVTMTLADRSRPLFGRLAGDSAESARIDLTSLGREIDAHLRQLGRFSPEIEVLAVQLMPEHLHAVIRVKRRMAKPLGMALRGFKGGASKIYWRLAGDGGAAARKPLFSAGYVDTILGDKRAVEQAVAYTRDNPRRLWEKRAHPEFFQVVREVRVELAVGTASARQPNCAPNCAPALPSAGFSAIGNQALLRAPVILQVQCSRSWFEYRRAPDGTLLKGAPPLRKTAEFDERCAAFLDAAAHGAVLLSPCISHGEREIARLAFERGHRVITLRNKGFNPLYKPGGKAFDQCAAGNLLLLAPIAWPYVPGEKAMTRADACVLNCIAQWIAGSGAAEIRYRGVRPADIAGMALAALGCPIGKNTRNTL